MTLTIRERALRGQLVGRALSFREVAQLFADDPAKFGPIAGRLERACRDKEIAAEVKTKEIRRRVLREVPCRSYGMWREPAEEVTPIVTDYLVAPDALLDMPSSLADDLPLLDACPALLAWLDLERAKEDDATAAPAIDDTRRARGGVDARTRSIQDEIDIRKPLSEAQAVQCVIEAVERDIAGGKLVFIDRASSSEYLFRFGDGTPQKVSSSNLARGARSYFKQVQKRAQTQRRQRA